jgi:hypothetical protein
MLDYVTIFEDGVRKGEDFHFHMVEGEDCFLIEELDNGLAVYSCFPYGHEVVARGARAVSLPKEKEV